MAVKIVFKANTRVLEASFFRLTKEIRIHLPNVVLDQCADYVEECLRETVPEKTGALKESIKITSRPDQRIITVEAPYAFYVEEGTKASPGRYVPAIDKRLVVSERRLRAAVFALAQRQGISRERAKNVFAVKVKTDKTLPANVAGEYHPETNTIHLSPKLQGKQKSRTIAHELFHATQELPTTKVTIVDWYRMEAAAEEAAKKASKVAQRDIGTHPGIKATHFFEKGFEKAAERFDLLFGDALDKIMSRVL